jgi:hypothetical protein
MFAPITRSGRRWTTVKRHGASMSLVWTKADGSAGDAAADLAECRNLAQDEGWRLGWERRWPPPFYDPRFMPPYYRWDRPFWRDYPLSLERQEALVEFSKGYRLELPY